MTRTTSSTPNGERRDITERERVIDRASDLLRGAATGSTSTDPAARAEEVVRLLNSLGGSSQRQP